MKLYFDEQSGLLVRLVRYAESPLGRAPTQIDYGDYRDVDGVETPFRWTVAQPDGSSTIQLEQVQQNVPIEPSDIYQTNRSRNQDRSRRDRRAQAFWMFSKRFPRALLGCSKMGAMYTVVRPGLLTALVVVSCFAASQTTAARIEPITSALRQRQFDQALQLLHSDLEQEPKNPQLWALRGIALSGKGNKKEALGAFRHALRISPSYLPALEGAAQIEYENGGNGAAPLLGQILKLHPGDPTSHAMLAVLDYRRGDCAAAVPHFEQGGSVVDSQPGAIQAYGDCLMKLKDTEKAIAIFVRALAQSNTDVDARYRLASAPNGGAESQRCHRYLAATVARKHGGCRCPRASGLRLRSRWKYSGGRARSSRGDSVGPA